MTFSGQKMELGPKSLESLNLPPAFQRPVHPHGDPHRAHVLLSRLSPSTGLGTGNTPPSPAQPCKGRGGSLSPTCKHHSEPGARIPRRSGCPEPLGRACSQAVTPRLGCTRPYPQPLSLITLQALGQSGLG